MTIQRLKHHVLIVFFWAAVLWFAGCAPEHQQTNDLKDVLHSHHWDTHVGSGTGIWVSVLQQRLMLIRDDQILKSYPCSTSAAGVGSQMNSGKTPPGWHRIAEKIGDGLPEGAVLKDRQWTGVVWQPTEQTDEDFILARILWLDGLEPGRNRGGTIDSHNRYIYIHGTNQIDALGHPASGGCIRISPQDVIDLYGRIDEGCRVLITSN